MTIEEKFALLNKLRMENSRRGLWNLILLILQSVALTIWLLTANPLIVFIMYTILGLIIANLIGTIRLGKKVELIAKGA